MRGLIFPLYVVFAAWMTVDAVRRRADWWWYLVIWILFPLGGWAYLFVVYLPDHQGLRRGGEQPGPGGMLGSAGIGRLRQQLEQVRSVDNLTSLAEALLEAQKVSEAVQLAEEAYRIDPNHKRAAFVLGAARLASSDFPGSEKVLAPLVALEPGYRDHEARYFLAEVRWRAGQRQEALRTSRELARTTRRLPHWAAYARYLHEDGQLREARLELEEALAEYESAPDHVRRLYRDAAREANYRLADLRKEAP